MLSTIQIVCSKKDLQNEKKCKSFIKQNDITHTRTLGNYIKDKELNITSQPIVPTAASTKKSQLQCVLLYFGCNEILRLNTKKSQVFPIGHYLLKNAEFTYIIECFPAKNIDKNNIQFCRVSIKKVYNFQRCYTHTDTRTHGHTDTHTDGHTLGNYTVLVSLLRPRLQ